MREFDLNIEKVLENWEVRHAVRELIANAFDEQVLTGTQPAEIKKDENGAWHIRDYGRGLNYKHFTQNENPEKINHPNLIGKFGVGLKDAFATFDRNGVKVEIRSKYGTFSGKHAKKAGFDDITTLHVSIEPATDENFVGTDCILYGCNDREVEEAKKFFLIFSGHETLETTKFGEIIDPEDEIPSIYVNGIKVAEEPNFAFSYNITSPTAALKKALNRERSNVGRGAYTERVKDILMAAESESVCAKMLEEFKKMTSGVQRDELKWLDVQVKFIKLLNEKGGVIFVTASEYAEANGRKREIVEESGKEIVFVPDSLMSKIDNDRISITGLSEVISDYMNSFEYEFVDDKDLSTEEKAVFRLKQSVIELVFPDYNGEILISEKLRNVEEDDTLGVCEDDQRIILLRKVLSDSTDFLGTLAHELIHAKSGASDCSRLFENYLTRCIGELLNKAVS